MTGDLAAVMPDVARALLGEPAAHLSTAREWRYGRRGSLAIDVERGLWRDHESATGGGVIALIRRERGGDTAAALRWLCEAAPDRDNFTRTRVPRTTAPRGEGDARRIAYALHVWQGARRASGSPVEAYLATRGLHLGLLAGEDGDCIRFAPACPFGPGTRRPAMLALLTDIATGAPTGIRRTALSDKCARARDASGNKLPHKALGRAGNSVARLGGATLPPAALALCEGVETGLSVIAASGATVWACPAGTLAKFPVLPGVERLAIYADNDPPGLSAARAAASRWMTAGRHVSIETPSRRGADFNDLWLENCNG